MARRKLVGSAARKTKAKSPGANKPAPSADTLDAELAARAIEKQLRNEQPTRDETAALKRAQRAKEEERRLDYYRTVPQKHYRQLAGGRQTKQLQDVARLYGIPCDGMNVDLFVVINGLHRLIAENANVIRSNKKGSPSDESAAEAERRRKVALADREEIKLMRERDDVVDARDVTASRLALVRWFVAEMERAGPALAIRLVGKKPGEIRQIVAAYFDAIRRRAIEETRTQQDDLNGDRGA